jgi:hypothetical protein
MRASRDAQSYLAMRADPDVFDERPNAPKQHLAKSTLQAQSEHLRLAASVVIEGGVSWGEIKSLADLIQPEVQGDSPSLSQAARRLGSRTNQATCSTRRVVPARTWQRVRERSSRPPIGVG